MVNWSNVDGRTPCKQDQLSISVVVWGEYNAPRNNCKLLARKDKSDWQASTVTRSTINLKPLHKLVSRQVK
ncbi:hypothetical protein T265_08026 [Opisthorchis viverrini]|uniref:Uncharacterized protein n=1 Tax=Opisthorchis viverrini TaxID=6198 RepID=A0A074ZAZ0_OPIVI|nr:hypothetical protein T265_08026 [Opisthorchis viverrini]KER24288.1 hypothetical protein T265_08026 [Opisthorchis viverrini]